MDPVLFFLLLLTLVQAAVMYAGLDTEIESPEFASGRDNVAKWGVHGVWSIHNDEKQAFHDAKYLIGGRDWCVSLADYRPYAVSASFGLIGTWLTAAGFGLLGVGNAGARLVYVVLACLANGLYALLCCKLLPGYWGPLAYGLHLTAFHTFFVARHAILENAYQLVLLATLCLYAYQPAFFVRHLDWICLASAVCLCLKWSFAVYQYALLGGLWLLEWSAAPGVFRLAAFTGAGLLACEGLNAVIHRRAGLLAGRYANVANVFSGHTGRSPAKAIVLPAPTWKSAPRYFQLAVRWLFAAWRPGPAVTMAGGLVLAGLVLVGAPAAAWGHGAPGRPILALAGFHLFFLALCCLLFFYPKRAVICFPLTWLLAVFAVAAPWPGLATSPWLAAAGAVGLAVFAGGNLAYARRVGRADGQGLAEAAARVEACLPEGECLHCDPYAYRALWRTRRLWKRTWDEQVKDQTAILAWALADGARYLALMEDNEAIPGELRLLLAPVVGFETTAAETDAPHRFTVYRLHPAYADRDGRDDASRGARNDASRGGPC